MPKIQIIKNPVDITLFGNNWKKVDNFTDKNIYTEMGQVVPAKYAGRRYQIIAKYERQYTFLERLKRAAQGVWLMICSFGSQWNSKKVNNLFYKNHEFKHFALLSDKKNDAEIPISKETHKKETKPISSLGADAHKHIFSFLDADGLAKSHLVSKTWNKTANDDKLWKASLPQVKIFGEKEWQQLALASNQALDVGIVPPLPKYLNKILQKKCPFFPGKKVGETHMLVLIPETINNEKFNLNYLEKLFRKMSIANSNVLNGAGCSFSIDSFNKHYDDSFSNLKKQSGKSHWILMTHQNIPNSPQRLKPVQYEDSLVEKKHYESMATQLSSMNYDIPNALEAATCFILKQLVFPLLQGKKPVAGKDKLLNTLCKFENQNQGETSSEFIFVSLPYDLGWNLFYNNTLQDDFGISPLLRL